MIFFCNLDDSFLEWVYILFNSLAKCTCNKMYLLEREGVANMSWSFLVEDYYALFCLKMWGRVLPNNVFGRCLIYVHELHRCFNEINISQCWIWKNMWIPFHSQKINKVETWGPAIHLETLTICCSSLYVSYSIFTLLSLRKHNFILWCWKLLQQLAEDGQGFWKDRPSLWTCQVGWWEFSLFGRWWWWKVWVACFWNQDTGLFLVQMHLVDHPQLGLNLFVQQYHYHWFYLRLHSNSHFQLV